MTLARFCMMGLLPALPCAAELTTAQQWALATSAVLTQHNGDRHDILGGAERTPESSERARKLLKRWWGATTHAEVLEQVAGLQNDLTDKYKAGWNLPRVVSVARWAYVAGFLEERESWDLIMPAARRVQRTFSSWQEMGAIYIAKRREWAGDDSDNSSIDWNYRQLVMDPKSPWRKLPWDTDLGGGERVPPSADKSAELEIWAREGGLTCFRVRLADKTIDPSWPKVMQQVIGCEPIVHATSWTGADGVLEGDCVQPGAVSSRGQRTKLHMEPVAAELRALGFTQMFLFLYHRPHAEVLVTPPIRDTWFNPEIENGQQTYFDTRSLREPYPDIALTDGPAESSIKLFMGASIALVLITIGWSIMMRVQLMNAPPVARANMLAKQWGLARVMFWLLWLVLAVVLNGMSIASFWSGGNWGDLGALRWLALGGFALRLIAELIVMTGVFQANSADLPFYKVAHASFWVVMMETPVAVVLLLLSNPSGAPNFVIMMAIVALALIIVQMARRCWMLAMDLRCGRIRDGEFHDAVFEMANRASVPLKRLFVIPEGAWPNLLPNVVPDGGLMVPARMLRSLSRREANCSIAYGLMMIKDGFLRWRDMTVLLLVAVAAPLAFLLQTFHLGPAATLTLVTGLCLCVWIVYGVSMQQERAKLELATLEFAKDPEAWIAGLAHAARLSGRAMDPKGVLRVASRAGIPADRLWAIANSGLPETGHYPLPEFSSEALALPA